DEQFWRLTLRQYLALARRWQEDQHRQDRRLQQVVWMLAEVNRDRQAKPEPFTLDDFALHRWPLLGDEPAALDAVSDADLAWAEIGEMRSAVMHRFGEAAGHVEGDDAQAAMARLNGHREMSDD